MSADLLEPIRGTMTAQPVLIFLAGPNGAGTTTFFDEYLEPFGMPYVNADRIARELRSADPRASAEAIDRGAFTDAERLRAAFIQARLSFCTETVFSDPERSKLRSLEDAHARGFAIFLIFIGLDSAALSVARVKSRARHGGHDVPTEKLHARFPRTLANLAAAIPLVDEAFVFDNSSYDSPYRIVAVYREGRLVSRHAPVPAWATKLPALRG